MSRRRIRTYACAALHLVSATVVTAPALGGDGALVADSVADFSALQGSDNWQYGYYASGGDYDSFTELCCYDPAGRTGEWWERAPAQPPWNLVWAEGQHPDAAWTVRRWICELSGVVRIDITTDHWPGEAGAKTVRVLNDGVVEYVRVLAAGQGGSLTESVLATVVRGGVLDFTVGADGDVTDDSTVVRAEIYRLAVLPPAVDAPSIIEIGADTGSCESSFVPVEPTVTASCQDGTIVITPARGDGLAIADPYPVGITRIVWTIEELDCPNDAQVFDQWILVRADGCPDCNGNGLPDDCGVYNLTRDEFFLTIQGAIDAALPGEEILVPAGTYDEPVDLLGKGIVLRSSGGPAVTLIDIEQMADTVITCTGGDGPQPVLDGFTITGGASPDDGGGMYVLGGSPTVTRCVFRDNTAGHDGAGMYITGGGAPTVSDCTFIGNVAGLHGGAVHCTLGSVTLSHCVFAGNSAVRGAGVYVYETLQVLVANCVFSGNWAPEGAGMWIGVFDGTGNPVVAVTSCTFSNNTGGLGDGMYILSACGPQVGVINTILWNQPVVDKSCTQFFEYNDGVFGLGANNINADPLFIDPDGDDGVWGTEDDDLRLQSGSPCIDAGTNHPVLGLDLSCTSDLDGNQRFVDDPDSRDTGFGDPPIIDMGAYEFASTPLVSGDLDGDGTVGIQDFLILLADWGPCPAQPDSCPADLDCDGEVGIVDFLALLANWS